MNGILLDTNIILDIAFKRADFFEKSKGHDSIILFIKGLIEYIDVCGVNKKTILNALNSKFNDFEDAVQSFSAIQFGIKIIITRNVSDFQTSDLQVLTPGEFIKQCKK